MSVISNKHMDIPGACKQMKFVIIIRREMLSTPSGSERVCFVCMSVCVCVCVCVCVAVSLCWILLSVSDRELFFVSLYHSHYFVSIFFTFFYIR